MLTPTQIEQYHDRGYVVARDVLSPADIARLRRVTDEFVEASREATEHTDIFDLEPGHTPQTPRLRRLKSPVASHAAYRDALRHEGILAIVSSLIGEGLRYNGDKLNMKWSGYGSAVEWHQDWAFYPHTNDDLLAVGIALDDMTTENGCMLMAPGSHKGPIYDHHQDGVFVGAITDDAFDPSGAVEVTMKAGSISLHHARIAHGSRPNTSASPRRLLLFQYCALDAWPLLGAGNWDAFNATIIRGEPTWTPRVTDVPVRIPLPSPERVGSIYEIQTQLRRPLLGDAVR
ncbi:phytanoyl-CoA dioxygenase family protein [Candidatus Poribacteria bacterium]|jgi:phytanoyl-CoA hydroxylase|nr:phytanoyl-CoA dioxygenase family protein [Candidatus Poribacteria bacterium]MBT5711913.1 phytanoyl-CoA dioxygenase family protein [Candidatus Poribacteria bacterium]MBT7096921.1 phytanoyl-CoA dioxygenase family protein [Candidatus Poribacteria bacterium]MBT7807323.1 phytanoyl-CoA dioxygenase family protein [Candidatus Poribacteria bacterium]